MEKEAEQKKGFFQRSGISLAPILVLLLSLCIVYFVYPQQAPITKSHGVATAKQTKQKIASAKVPSHVVKNKTNTNIATGSIPTPTPSSAQVAAVPQQTTNTISPNPMSTPSVILPQTTPPNVQKPTQNNTSDNTTNTASNPQAETQEENKNLTLAGTTQNVKQILPVIGSVLDSGTDKTTQGSLPLGIGGK